MESKTGFLTQDEMEAERLRVSDYKFKSNFNFLKAHKGFTDGEMHLLIAPKGAGKSSLMRSIIFEIIRSNKVMIYLSEETRESYLSSINEAYYLATNGNMPEKFLNNINCICEIDLPMQIKKEDIFFLKLREEIERTKSEILIFDNFTTSWMSGLVGKEKTYLEIMKKQAVKLKIPYLLIAHTSKNSNIKNGYFTGDDVRGNHAISNIASYLYTITRVNNSPIRTFLYLEKARGHFDIGGDRFFELEYDKKTGFYRGDKEVTREDVLKEISNYNAVGKTRKGGFVKEKKDPWV